MAKKALVILTLIVTAWWLKLFFTHSEGQLENYIWVVVLTFVPIIGGINGLIIAKKWGGWSSIFGRSVIFISLGLLGWAFGDTVWSYYNIFQKVEVPYPSLADFGFFSMVPFWSLGMFFLFQAAGGKYALKSLAGKVLLLFLPLVGFVLSYFLFLKDKTFDGGSMLKSFFDIAYPLGDMITISAALLVLVLTARILGGRMRVPIIVLILGFIFQYIADFSFSYTSTTGAYFNGSWVDMAYLLAQFFVSFGLAGFLLKED